MCHVSCEAESGAEDVDLVSQSHGSFSIFPNDAIAAPK